MLSCESAGLGWPPNVRTPCAGLPRRYPRGACAGAPYGRGRSSGLRKRCVAPCQAGYVGLPSLKLDRVPSSCGTRPHDDTAVQGGVLLSTFVRVGRRGFRLRHGRSSELSHRGPSREAKPCGEAAWQTASRPCASSGHGAAPNPRTRMQPRKAARSLPLLSRYLPPGFGALPRRAGRIGRYAGSRTAARHGDERGCARGRGALDGVSHPQRSHRVLGGNLHHLRSSLSTGTVPYGRGAGVVVRASGPVDSDDHRTGAHYACYSGDGVDAIQRHGSGAVEEGRRFEGVHGCRWRNIPRRASSLERPSCPTSRAERRAQTSRRKSGARCPIKPARCPMMISGFALPQSHLTETAGLVRK